MKVKKIEIQFDGVEHGTVLAVKNIHRKKGGEPEECFTVYHWWQIMRIPLQHFDSGTDCSKIAKNILEQCSVTSYNEMDIQEVAELIELLISN